ncbi:hypothetical protein AHAS_Ahas13G0373100 [Arachis hypogaea]
MSKIVRKIKTIVKEIPCLSIPDPKTNLIVKTDASELGTDCKAAPSILKNDVKNLAILSCFDFTIEHIKGESNALPDFLTREFLQGRNKYTLLQLSDLFKIKPLSEEHPYHEKSIPMKIMALEKEWFKMDRRTLYKIVFSNTFHYPSVRSIELTHNKDPTTKDTIYSKIKILKVITLLEWKRHFFKCKNFTKKFEHQNYSYYDYIDV